MFFILPTCFIYKQESWAVAKTTARCALCMGALKIFRSPWQRTWTLFPNFSWASVPIEPINVHAKFEIRTFNRSWDNKGYPKILGSPWICPRSLFSEIFNGLLFGWTPWMYWPNLKSVAFPVPEITGVPEKIGQSLYTPTLPFLQKFSWAFVRMDPVIVLAKFEVCSFTRSWNNSDWSFGLGLRLRTPNLME